MRTLLLLIVGLSGCFEGSEDTESTDTADTGDVGTSDVGTDDPDTEEFDTDAFIPTVSISDCGPTAIESFPFRVQGEDFVQDAGVCTANEHLSDCRSGSDFGASFLIELEDRDVVHVWSGPESGARLLMAIATDGDPRRCIDDTDAPSEVSYTASGTQIVRVYLEGRSQGADGAYEILFDVEPSERCWDTFDNDGDGDISCADSDCAASRHCNGTCPEDGSVVEFSASQMDEHGYRNPQGWYSEVELRAGESLLVPYRLLDNVTTMPAIRAQTPYLIDGCDVDVPLEMHRGWLGALHYRARVDERVSFLTFRSLAVGVLSPEYSILPPEYCLPGLDSDRDYLTYCEDPDCWDEPACGQTCDALDITEDMATFGAYTMSTADFSAAYDDLGDYRFGSLCGVGFSNFEELPEARFRLWMRAGETVRLRSHSGRMRTRLMVQDRCAPEGYCFAADHDSVTYTATTDGEVFLIAEAEIAGPNLPLDLLIELSQPEVCDNGVDDDFDGQLDCFDSDCSEFCTSTCGLAVDLPFREFGQNFSRDFPELFLGVADPVCSAIDGSDALYVVDLLEGQTLRARDVSRLDATVRIYDACPDTGQCLAEVEVDAVGSWRDYPMIEQLDFTAPHTGQYWVHFTTPYSEYSQRYDFRMGISSDEDCHNGVDDDLDGAADCADWDCSHLAECAFECPVGQAESVFLYDVELNDYFLPTIFDCQERGCEAGEPARAGALVNTFAMEQGEFLRVFDTSAYLLVHTVRDACEPDSAPLDISTQALWEWTAPHSGDFTLMSRLHSGYPSLSQRSAELPGDYVAGVVSPEVCGNGLDDDLDGWADCADCSCSAFPACSVLATPSTITLPYRLEGDDISLVTQVTQYGLDESCGYEQWHQLVRRVQLTERMGLRITAEVQMGFSLRLQIYDVSCADPSNCDTPLAESLSSPDSSILLAVIPHTGEYDIVVEYKRRPEYPLYPGFVLTVEAPLSLVPEDCANGVDDDGNGEVDCEDRRCRSDASCGPYETVCGDGIDNDDDGDVDCDDSDCLRGSSCIVEVTTAPSVDFQQFEQPQSFPFEGWTTSESLETSRLGWQICTADSSCAGDRPAPADTGLSMASVAAEAPLSQYLVSPVFDLTEYVGATLVFHATAYGDPRSWIAVEARRLNGEAWVLLPVQHHVRYVLDEFAGESNIQVRVRRLNQAPLRLDSVQMFAR